MPFSSDDAPVSAELRTDQDILCSICDGTGVLFGDEDDPDTDTE